MAANIHKYQSWEKYTLFDQIIDIFTPTHYLPISEVVWIQLYQQVKSNISFLKERNLDILKYVNSTCMC